MTSSSPDPSEYQPELEEIKPRICDILSKITGPSTFACGETISEYPNPGLILNEHGGIGLPLSEHDAEAIISKARQSPFGKGAETLVDTTVRRSWQLEPSQFQIRNPQWNSTVNKILGQVYTNLGLSGGAQNVSAQLYKLLLYEEGAFFKPHKDSEKTPGMFGTLVICLSSAHEGGDLVLTHNKETMTMSLASEFSMSSAAWYSDVLHEVKPVTSGYRLVLTYNLVRQNWSPEEMSLVYGRHKDQLVTALRQYETCLKARRFQYDCPDYLIHPLGHQYTQVSLRADQLKGADLGQTQCLQKAAGELGFALYLANMERTVVRDDGENMARRDNYGYGSRWNADDDDYDEYGEEISNETDFRFVARLDNGTRVDDDESLLGRVHVDADAMLDREAYECNVPDDKERSGFTGNEGCTATYWYRDTVLVIVPPAKRVPSLFECDVKGREIRSWVKRLQIDADSDVSKMQELADLCKAVLDGRPGRGRDLKDPFQIALMQQTALAALQVENVALFDRAMKDVTTPLPEEAYRRFGCLMARTSDTDAVETRVVSALKATRYLNMKYQSLLKVEQHFRDTVSGDVVPDQRVRFSYFSEKTLEEMADQAITSGTMRKVDGASLANIAGRWDLVNFAGRFLPGLLAQGVACKAAFANRLFKLLDSAKDEYGDIDTSLVSDGQQMCKAIYMRVWFAFELESQTTVAQLRSDRHKMSNSERMKAYDETLLNGDELADLLNNTFNLKAAREDQARSQLISSIKSVTDSATYVHTLLPFIKAILEQKVEMYRLDSDGQLSPQSVQMVTSSLESYITRFVGKEPKAPSDWSQLTRGCRSRCSDCAAVNRFLQSPTQKVGRFPMCKSRRQHLHNCFNNVSDVQYTIETLRNTEPNIWQITKHNKQYNNYESWKRRHDDATKRVKALQEAGPLRSYLGDMAEAVLSCDAARIAEARTHSGPFTEHAAVVTPSRLPLQNASPNSQPASVSRGSKRSANDDLVAKGEKRARPASPPDSSVQTPGKLVDIIDLTDD
ncbi:hypothetical protein PV11_02022 [Exophiala sideris]|uniref:Fe2OG dioxygenase domain-containing protein n=1 Tax=Exophiala sideris TaxID=1016849 RepID=A0A0D1WCC8_9EURO|nr:hypothetical protein PV11_02022 [Exophiala sideris]